MYRERSSVRTTSSKDRLNVSNRIHKGLAMTCLGAILVLTSCEPPSIDASDAKTTYKLLDVTTGAGYKDSRSGESYWENKGGSDIYRCYQDPDLLSQWSKEPYGCEKFTPPSLLPSDAELVAINVGHLQQTLSVWDLGDARLKMCEHDKSFFGNKTLESTGPCKDFKKPSQVDEHAKLASINAGSEIQTQSFWINPDGGVTACDHNVEYTGIFGLGNKGVAEATVCQSFKTPTDKFPNSVDTPLQLIAVTSDSNRPAESFWQSAKGYLVRCLHEKVGSIFARSIGDAYQCGYFQAPPLK